MTAFLTICKLHLINNYNGNCNHTKQFMIERELNNYIKLQLKDLL